MKSIEEEFNAMINDIDGIDRLDLIHYAMGYFDKEGSIPFYVVQLIDELYEAGKIR